MTQPSHRWLEQLIAVLEADRQNGLVGPLSNRVIPEQKIRIRLSSPSQVHTFSARFNRSGPAKWRISPRLSGFCLAFPARLVEAIGYLDEGFRVGTYEDDDYCYRARRAGYRCMVAGDTYVHHFGNRSFRRRGREAFRQILVRNRRYFVTKWGKTPEEVRKEKIN